MCAVQTRPYLQVGKTRSTLVCMKKRREPELKCVTARKEQDLTSIKTIFNSNYTLTKHTKILETSEITYYIPNLPKMTLLNDF